MIIRPDRRKLEIFDVLLEFKYVKLSEVSLTAEQARKSSQKMKLLFTSDWHMGVYGDPGDALKLDNWSIMSLLDKWEDEYDMILLNGDILEVLKSSKVFFSHADYTLNVIENRKPVIKRFLENPKYIWTAGNHDYPLEDILNLPISVKIPLADGYTLIAEHGHLLKASKEKYCRLSRHSYMFYFMIWKIDQCISLVRQGASIEFIMDNLIIDFWKQRKQNSLSNFNAIKDFILKAGFIYSDIGIKQKKLTSPYLADLFAERAKGKFYDQKTIVIMGHIHYLQIQKYINSNIYINLGRFCRDSKYKAVDFDTETGKISVPVFGRCIKR